MDIMIFTIMMISQWMISAVQISISPIPITASVPYKDICDVKKTKHCRNCDLPRQNTWWLVTSLIPDHACKGLVTRNRNLWHK